MYPTCDNGTKDESSSARRLARMFGRDYDSADLNLWQEVAQSIADEQQAKIISAICAVTDSSGIQKNTPLVSAGVGAFIVGKIADVMGRDCLRFDDLLKSVSIDCQVQAIECAPAVSVALLAQNTMCDETL